MKASVGKCVGGGLYVHKTAVGLLPPEAVQTLSFASEVAGGIEWNVVRISKESVTFLLYESLR